MFRFEKAERIHCDMLVENLRDEEWDELWASHGKSAWDAVPITLHLSDEAFAAFEDDTLLCLTGVVPYFKNHLTSGVGSPWLLTTKELPKRPRRLLQWTKVFIDKWSDEYRYLINYVDARYTQSLRWAKWAGFEISPEPIPYGPFDMPFHEIKYMR